MAALISSDHIAELAIVFAQHYLVTYYCLVKENMDPGELERAKIHSELHVFDEIRELSKEGIENNIKGLEECINNGGYGYNEDVTCKADAVMTDWIHIVFVREYLAMSGEMDRIDFMGRLYDTITRFYDTDSINECRKEFDELYPKTWDTEHFIDEK